MAQELNGSAHKRLRMAGGPPPNEVDLLVDGLALNQAAPQGMLLSIVPISKKGRDWLWSKDQPWNTSRPIVEGYDGLLCPFGTMQSVVKAAIEAELAVGVVIEMQGPPPKADNPGGPGDAI